MCLRQMCFTNTHTFLLPLPLLPQFMELLRPDFASNTINPGRMCIGESDICLSQAGNGYIVIDKTDKSATVARFSHTDQDKLQVYFNARQPDVDAGYAYVSSEGNGVMGAYKNGFGGAQLWSSGHMCFPQRDLCISQSGNLNMVITNYDGNIRLAQFRQ